MENAMFCFQCEQTVGGKGCTKLGVCGKTPEIAGLQDLLIYQLKGISCYAKALIDQGEKIDKEIVGFVENSLFTTLTNVNFDAQNHVKLLRQSQELKQKIRSKAPKGDYNDYATYNLSSTKEEMLKDAEKAGIMYDDALDPDIRSLRWTITYGLKGISAYGHQARVLGFSSDEVDDFYFIGLEATTNDDLGVEELIRMTMRTGAISEIVMRVLDDANTSIYENPSPNQVNVKTKKGPFIVVSGHDLRDLEMLLEQSVNGLPLTIILSWYEQKALADLLSLLNLGVKGIVLGPTLPAFLSPNVLQYLVDTFDLQTISMPEDDLKAALKQIV